MTNDTTPTEGADHETTLYGVSQAALLRAHILDRLKKSKMVSPAINISRPGWQFILDLVDIALRAAEHHLPQPSEEAPGDETQASDERPLADHDHAPR